MAQALRERGHDPQAVAHFVNRLVFCMFADDVGLLPGHMFTRMLRHAHPAPERFPELAGELNPYAAELARVSVWVGEIQWMRRNGFAEARNPILKPLDTIECRDAILTPDDREPEWPVADIVIGNPPFLGGKLLITHLGEA